MKIRSHPESHIVELDDGSRWKIFPGDLDVPLKWKPETDLRVERIDEEVSSHALVCQLRQIAGSRNPRKRGVAGPRSQKGARGRLIPTHMF